jgi:alpha-L-fucosidase
VTKEHLRSAATEAALDGDPDTFWSAPAGSHHAILEADFAKPVRFDRAMTI